MILLSLVLAIFGVSSLLAGSLPKRSNTDFIEFNGIWYSIGGNANTHKVSNDIRISHNTDDKHGWSRIVDKPGFLQRYGHRVYVRDHKIWVEDGKDRHHNDLHDKWYSEDGHKWHKDH